MRVVWSRRAIRHLVAARDYIAKDSPQAAADLAAKILAAVDLLARQPEMGRPGRLSPTRELVIPGTPYVIPYRVSADRIEIIAVFHGRQRWPDSL